MAEATARPSLRTCACTSVRLPGALLTLPAWVFGVAACIQAITVSVTIFGWSNLVVALIDDGVFSDECSAGEDLPCDAQTSRLNLMFVIGAALTNASSLLVNGWVMDLYGVKVALVVSLAFLVTAYGIMAGAAGGSIAEDSYFGGFVLLGLGQTGMLHPLFSMSNLFPGYESLVIGIINGFADSAVVVFLAFRQLYEGGASLESIYIGYIAGPLVLATLFTLVLWPWFPVPPGGVGVLILPDKEELETPGVPSTPEVVDGAAVELVVQEPGSPPAEADGAQEAAQLDEGASAPMEVAAFDPAFPYANAGFWEQLCSPLYVGLAIFNIISLIKFSWFLSMIGDHLTFLGQEEGEYTTILGAVLPVGVIFVLVVGGTIDRYGMHIALAGNFVASLLLSVVTLIPSLPLQVVGFVVFAFFRAGLFTILTAILGKEFTFATFGRLIGVLSVGSAVLGLVNQPLFEWSLSAFGGDFTPVNALYGCITLLQGLFVVYYWRYRTIADGPGHTTAFTWWPYTQADSSDSANHIIDEPKAGMSEEEAGEAEVVVATPAADEGSTEGEVGPEDGRPAEKAVASELEEGQTTESAVEEEAVSGEEAETVEDEAEGAVEAPDTAEAEAVAEDTA